MIQNQNEEIQRIKDKQGDIKSSLRGNTSFDLQRKLESVERELRGEIESIRNSMRGSNQFSESYGLDEVPARNDFSRDFKLQYVIIIIRTTFLLLFICLLIYIFIYLMLMRYLLDTIS